MTLTRWLFRPATCRVRTGLLCPYAHHTYNPTPGHMIPHNHTCTCTRAHAHMQAGSICVHIYHMKVPVAWLRTRGVASALELDSYSGVAALYARRHSSAPFVRALPPASPLHSAWWFPHPYASAYLNGQYVNLSCHFMQTNRTGQLKEHLR